MQALEGQPTQAIPRPPPSPYRNPSLRPCRKDGALVTGAVIALAVVVGGAACVSGFVFWLLVKVVRTDRRRGGGR